MKSANEITELIISRYIEIGVAQGAKNRFIFIEAVSDGICIKRESGTFWPIKKEQIVRAVEAVRHDPTIYGAGPTKLKPYINERVQSPLWAMLHLLSLDEIVDKV